MMTPKYEFTGETKIHLGITLRRIRATMSFGVVAKGDVGGWIETEKNISTDPQVSGNAWVYGAALVYGNARVYGDARVYGNAQLGKESLLLVDHLEAMAKLKGWPKRKKARQESPR